MARGRYFISTTMKAKQVWLMIGAMSIFLLVVSCDVPDRSSNGNGVPIAENQHGTRDWEKVIYECISKVESSAGAFYVRGRQVTGQDVARQLRKNLNVILRVKSLPDPFGQNAGILLAVMTTYEGYPMDGITGRPEPFELEVQGRRMTVYAWLKQELKLGVLPGEEEGHQILLPLYDALATPELLRQWEEYLDKCIAVTEQARDCRFYLRGKYYSSGEASKIFASNRVRAIEELTIPDIKHPDLKDLYNSRSVLFDLTYRPPPGPEEHADRSQYSRELRRWTSEKSYVEYNSTKEDVIDWLGRNVGEPPPMPKLKKKSKESG